jgi:4-hydroxy-tetrahydrodipicolinate synthase
MNFAGAWTALVTPMKSDGAVDWEGLEKNLAFQIDAGIAGLVPTGTSGESPTLSWEEHNSIIERTLKQADGKCKVIAGTGSNSTQEAVESTEHAVEHGAKAALLIDCYYNGPSSLELRNEYHGMLAEMFPDVDFVPYVIPGRTGTALSVEDLAILASEYPNIHAVKEATGDLERMAYTRELLGPNFFILSGDDGLTAEMMIRPDIRAAGVISVISNVAPKAISEMVGKLIAGDADGASVIGDALAPLFEIVGVSINEERVLPGGKTVEVLDKFRNPLPIKTLMTGLGMPSGVTRQPLGKMTREGVAVVRSAARKVWEKNPEILAPVGEFFGVDVEARLADDSVWAAVAYP